MITPLEELVNIPEFETAARQTLDSQTFGLIAGGDRKAFDRITFRPRMMVNTTKLDLTRELFSHSLFAPVLVAPLSHQKRFHPDAELATARGAAAAKAVMVIADRSDAPVEQIISAANGAAWYQIEPANEVDSVRDRVRSAVAAGCSAVCLTAGGWDWTLIDRFRKGVNAPLLLKGVMSGAEARTAVDRGVQGIIVSNYVEPGITGMASPMEVLPGIAEAVGGRVPVLIDGGFRRGGDILMALALGAGAVMIGRPVLWGLATYGNAGVQRVLEMLQTELARDMAMCGRVNLKSVDRTLVKIHRW